MTYIIVLCKVDGYLSANASGGSYYQGHLLFRRHRSCNWIEEGSRMFDRAQCIMNGTERGSSIAAITRLRAGDIDVGSLLSLYALVP